MISLWNDIQQGYGMLCQKAMKNINRFQRLGLKYSDAVLLAKIPDILHKYGYTINEESIQAIIDKYIIIRQKNTEEKEYARIANALISSYKALDYTERFGDHLNDYTLQESDFEDVQKNAKTILE